MTFSDLLAQSQLPRPEARLLVLKAIGKRPSTDKAWMVAHEFDEASAEQAEDIKALYVRRARGEPMAYLLGYKEFFSHEFMVGPGVLIPRPETELLVSWGVEVLKQRALISASCLDLACGSGCVGLSLGLEAKKQSIAIGTLCLSDVSPQALRYTALNNDRLIKDSHPEMAALIRQAHSEWFETIGARFDLIVSNPPYVKANDKHLEQGDVRYEPSLALVSGADGLDAIKHIVAHAPSHLNAGGSLLLEHGFDQADAVRNLLKQAGFSQVQSRKDLAGIERVTGGTYSGSL